MVNFLYFVAFFYLKLWLAALGTEIELGALGLIWPVVETALFMTGSYLSMHEFLPA